MNWETYNSMTVKQKEEYKFKFDDKTPFLDARGLLSWVTVFLLVVTHFMMVIYLAMTDENFINLKEQVGILFQATAKLIYIMGITISIFIISYAGSLFISIYVLNKWMKDNKIKKIKGKPFWRK